MSDETLATELLHQLKQNSQRWFAAFCIMVILEISTIIGFIWYISLPVEEYATSYEQSAGDIRDSEVKQIIGGTENGEGEAESN